MNTISLLLAAALAMMTLEAHFPGRPLPAVRGWWTRAALLNLCQTGSVHL